MERRKQLPPLTAVVRQMAWNLWGRRCKIDKTESRWAISNTLLKSEMSIQAVADHVGSETLTAMRAVPFGYLLVHFSHRVNKSRWLIMTRVVTVQ